MLMNEIVIFKPNSRAKEAAISGPVQGRVVDALEERMGVEMAKKARTAFKSMNKNGFDALQFKFTDKLGERRIRVRQTEV